MAAVLQVSGCMTLDVSFQASFILLDLVVTVAAGLIAEFFFLSVDYSRTETLQFEDDEYYYYVKAVPKVGVTLPEKQVKHITEPHEEQPKGRISRMAPRKLALPLRSLRPILHIG